MAQEAYTSFTLIDVTDGMIWKGELDAPPQFPQQGWAYYNNIEKKSYIYDGEEWQTLAQDGASGINLIKRKNIEIYFDNVKQEDLNIATTQNININNSATNSVYILLNFTEQLNEGIYTLNAIVQSEKQVRLYSNYQWDVDLSGYLESKPSWTTTNNSMPYQYYIDLTLPCTFSITEETKRGSFGISNTSKIAVNNSLLITDLKLEQGPVETPWQAAPADLIANTENEYYISSSKTELLNGEWSKIYGGVDLKLGEYLWKRTLVTFSDGHQEYQPTESGYCDMNADPISYTLYTKTSEDKLTFQVMKRDGKNITDITDTDTTAYTINIRGESADIKKGIFLGSITKDLEFELKVNGYLEDVEDYAVPAYDIQCQKSFEFSVDSMGKIKGDQTQTSSIKILRDGEDITNKVTLTKELPTTNATDNTYYLLIPQTTNITIDNSNKAFSVKPKQANETHTLSLWFNGHVFITQTFNITVRADGPEGRNYLLKTSTDEKIATIEANSDYGNIPQFKLSTQVWDGGYVDIAEYGLTIGDTVTFSAYLIPQNQKEVAVRLHARNDESSDTQRFTGNYIQTAGISAVTVTLQKSTIYLSVCYPENSSTETQEKYSKCKLERGSQATPWSPAPEDVLAYTINVSGENVQIAETEVKALKDLQTKRLSTMTIEALKGAAAQTITITKIGTSSISDNVDSNVDTGIAGLQYQLSGYGTTKSIITFYCSNALVANGQVIIEFTVDGKSFTKTFSFSISEQGEQGPPGLPVKDLILSSTATEVQVSLDDDGNYVYLPDSITFTAEPKNLTTGTYAWEGNSSTDNFLTIEPNNSDQNITFPYTATVTFTEDGTGQEYTKSITVTCPRQIKSSQLVSQNVTYYAVTENSYTPPYLKGQNDEPLNTNQPGYPQDGTPSNNKPNDPWIWKTTQIKQYYTYTYSDNKTQDTNPSYTLWSEWELACENASDVKAFNALTNNEKFKGHFYGVYVWTDDYDHYFYNPGNTYTKKLIQPLAIDIANDALFLSMGSSVERINPPEDLTTGKVQGETGKTLKDYIDYYVNASMVQTGSLLVGTQDNPIFMAGFDQDEIDGARVKIAGFDVDENSLQSTKNGYVYLGTDAIKLGTKSGEHHPFEVNDQGELYSISGKIGGWNINTQGLYNSTPEKNIYLKRIYYSFAQGDSADQTIENAVSLTYQDSLINLVSYYPIFVKRTFDYGNFTLSTITKMTIRAQQATDTWITAYNIYYSNDKSIKLPSSVDNPEEFEQWSKWLPTRNELYDYICVNWSASTDNGFDPLVPYDSKTNVPPSEGIFTLTDYRQEISAYYFGCNSDENIQNSSLLDNSNSAIVFYAGGNILNLQEAAFQVLRDGSVYMKALQVDRLISKGQELNFGVVTKYTGGNYRSGITMYSEDTQLLTQSAYGFYIGFDGANFGQLYLSGKKVNINPSNGYLYIIT